MLAIVDAEMSIRPRAPLCSRSGDSGAFGSVNGTCAASLIRSLHQGAVPGLMSGTCLVRIMRGTAVDSQQRLTPPPGKRFPILRNVPDVGPDAQGVTWRTRGPRRSRRCRLLRRRLGGLAEFG